MNIFFIGKIVLAQRLLTPKSYLSGGVHCFK